MFQLISNVTVPSHGTIFFNYAIIDTTTGTCYGFSLEPTAEVIVEATKELLIGKYTWEPGSYTVLAEFSSWTTLDQDCPELFI